MVFTGALAAMHAGELGANQSSPLQGLYERIDIGAYLLWMAVLAVALLLRRGNQRRRGTTGAVATV
jgi:hypothetical protein